MGCSSVEAAVAPAVEPVVEPAAVAAAVAVAAAAAAAAAAAVDHRRGCLPLPHLVPQGLNLGKLRVARQLGVCGSLYFSPRQPVLDVAALRLCAVHAPR